MPGFGQSKERNKSKATSTQLQTLLNEAVRLHKAGQIEKAENLYLQALSSGFEHEIILSNLGVIYKRTNRIDKAIEIYKRAISLNPEFADAHANLGGLLQEKKDYAAAYISLCKAIALNPSHAVAHSNLGLTLQAKGECREALNSALKAIRMDPNLASAYMNLGNILKEQGQLAQAEASCQKAIGVDSSFIPAYVSLGTIYKDQGNLDQALSAILAAQKLKPEYAPTYIVMGSILQERGQLEEAIHATKQAIKLDPSGAVAYINLGIMLQGKDLLTEAFTATQKAIELDPNSAMAHRSLGAICRDKGDMEYALTATSTSIRLNPNDAVAYMNLGCIYAELCDHEQAERYYEKALEMDPSYVAAQVNLSQSQLLRHDYKNGWRNYRNRKEKPVVTANDQISRRSGIDDIGDISPTQNVLITGEQGIGDQILFASLLQEMQVRCKQVFVTVDERLVPLFRRSFSGNIEFYPHNIQLPDLPVDTFVSMGDLGALFRQEKSCFNSQQSRYLTAKPAHTEGIFAGLRGERNKKIVGLSWHSAGKRYFNRKKSISVDDLGSILVNSTFDLIKLQYGDCEDDIAHARDCYNLKIREIPNLDVTNDIDGLASLISACDEVVTISNATAHLAGALGKPTHSLAPASPHFYWGLHESTSVWYPTIKIYRQTKEGDWKYALSQVANALQH